MTTASVPRDVGARLDHDPPAERERLRRERCRVLHAHIRKPVRLDTLHLRRDLQQTGARALPLEHVVRDARSALGDAALVSREALVEGERGRAVLREVLHPEESMERRLRRLRRQRPGDTGQPSGAPCGSSTTATRPYAPTGFGVSSTLPPAVTSWIARSRSATDRYKAGRWPGLRVRALDHAACGLAARPRDDVGTAAAGRRLEVPAEELWSRTWDAARSVVTRSCQTNRPTVAFGLGMAPDGEVAAFRLHRRLRPSRSAHPG